MHVVSISSLGHHYPGNRCTPEEGATAYHREERKGEVEQRLASGGMHDFTSRHRAARRIGCMRVLSALRAVITSSFKIECRWASETPPSRLAAPGLSKVNQRSPLAGRPRRVEEALDSIL
ncbi:hypothetical protein EVAR_58771_1 [Eumeta japonica]|uniref:Uncharacterized protein n=1 Tax=Eumeta variegata TaxID=151549 RepID=A0A4C1ZTS2_EUMVA|nr:hypothetical protein EVAR_58771_1 [Eumeta japonica]